MAINNHDKELYLETLGCTINLRRNTRIKRLSIKIHANSGIIVCIPKQITNTQAIKFVLENKDWIKKHKKQTNKISISNTLKLITAEISFKEIEHNIPTLERKSSAYIVYIPKSWNSSYKQKRKLEVADYIMKKEAETFIPKRVEYLAKKHNFNYNKVSLRNQKTLWGSCSYNNNISLNIQLIRLPLHLIDYIIIHELSHTIHKNHSQKFWNLVDDILKKTTNNCKKELKTIPLHL